MNTGLVAYYPFNGNADDESGNGHHGTVFGATLVADRFGTPNTSFSFDGNDRIDVPDDPNLTFGSEPFTISVWAQLSTFGADGGYYLMGHSEGPGNTNKWIFWHGNSGISLVVGPSPGWIGLGSSQFQLGVWYHIIIQRIGSDLVAYINTMQIGTASAPQVIPDPNAILQIGTAEPDRPNRVYQGLIDDIRIYNRALTQAEIDSLYNETPTSVETIHSNNPIRFELKQNYPNPFNPTTKIKYQLPDAGFVTLKVYDVLGNEIATLVNEEKQTGTYEITWYAENLPSGIYFYRLQAGSFILTKKMVLMK